MSQPVISTRGNAYTHKMTLVANPAKSLYFNKMSQYVDSCNSTPEGKAKLREIQLKAWRVVQPDGTVTYDGRKLGLAPKRNIFYTSPKSRSRQNDGLRLKCRRIMAIRRAFLEMEWTIANDLTKNILGYECIMAQTDYHGRKWTAWFSPEIPVHEGPWKLHGLPGIVLRAEAGDRFIIEGNRSRLYQTESSTLRYIP